jgi:uncharacterized cupin superfamily protein
MKLSQPLALLSLTGTSIAFTATSPQARCSTSLASSYLESLQLSTGAATFANAPSTSSPSPSAPTSSPPDDHSPIHHAPLSYLSHPHLTSKGPRATFDWGAPQDASRKLCDDGVFRAGAWYCSEGGWESPNGKGATEVFYVLEGHGMLGDADGAQHWFGPVSCCVVHTMCQSSECYFQHA